MIDTKVQGHVADSMKLVFLDIDGVLNNHDFEPERMSATIHRDKVERLNRILRH